jgi:putative endonuclease
MARTRQFGQKGEALAVAYLRRHGYQILDTNWHCRSGEIDIVAQKDETVVFVEVRSRHAVDTAPAFASIDPRKRAKLQASAESYLSARHLEDVVWRIDVIAIAVPREGVPIIEQLENALDW